MVIKQAEEKQSEVLKTGTLYSLLHLILEVVPHGEPHQLLHQLLPRACLHFCLCLFSVMMLN